MSNMETDRLKSTDSQDENGYGSDDSIVLCESEINKRIERHRQSPGILSELKESFWEARYVGLVSAIIGLLLALNITVIPYRGARWLASDIRIPSTMADLKRIRPVLSADEMGRVQRDLMGAETQFWLPEPWFDRIKLRFDREVSKEGHHKPPDMFYTGVTYGMTAYNSHDLEYSSDLAEGAFESLGNDLRNMKPFPSAVMQRNALNQGITIGSPP